MGTPVEGNAAVIYTNTLYQRVLTDTQASEYSSVLRCYIMLTGSYSSLEQHGATEVLVLICQPT